MTTSPLRARTLSALNLYRSCVCCPSLCEVIHVSVLLCLEDTVCLVSCIPSSSYKSIFHGVSWALREELGWWHPFKDPVLQSLSLSEHSPSMNFCVGSQYPTLLKKAVYCFPCVLWDRLILFPMWLGVVLNSWMLQSLKCWDHRHVPPHLAKNEIDSCGFLKVFTYIFYLEMFIWIQQTNLRCPGYD